MGYKRIEGAPERYMVNPHPPTVWEYAFPDVMLAMSRRNDKSPRMQQIRFSTGFADLTAPLGIRPNVWIAAISKEIFKTCVGTSQTNVNLLLVNSSLHAVQVGLKGLRAPAWQSAHASILEFVKGAQVPSRRQGIGFSKTAQKGPVPLQTPKQTGGVAAAAVVGPLQTVNHLPGSAKPTSDRASLAGRVQRATRAIPSKCRVL